MPGEVAFADALESLSAHVEVVGDSVDGRLADLGGAAAEEPATAGLVCERGGRGYVVAGRRDEEFFRVVYPASVVGAVASTLAEDAVEELLGTDDGQRSEEPDAGDGVAGGDADVPPRGGAGDERSRNGDDGDERLGDSGRDERPRDDDGDEWPGNLERGDPPGGANDTDRSRDVERGSLSERDLLAARVWLDSLGSEVTGELRFHLTDRLSDSSVGYTVFPETGDAVYGFRVERKVFPYDGPPTAREFDRSVQAVVSVGSNGYDLLARTFDVEEESIAQMAVLTWPSLHR